MSSRVGTIEVIDGKQNKNIYLKDGEMLYEEKKDVSGAESNERTKIK